MALGQSLTRRDGVLVLIGASCVYILTAILSNGIRGIPSIVVHPNLSDSFYSSPHIQPLPNPSIATQNLDLGLQRDFPETSIVAHAPGWTLFRDLYMANGTLFLLSSNPDPSTFPEIRLMTSTGLPAANTPENIALREPTKQDMDFIDPEEARTRWSGDVVNGERNRVRTVEGTTMLVNDPSQFLDHYFHFVAELLLGAWAFMYGAFNPSSGLIAETDTVRPLPPLAPSYNPQKSETFSFTRAIFMHANADGWRDKPGFNSFVLRAAFPSLDVEVAVDWADRVDSTAPPRRPSPESAQHSRDLQEYADHSGRAWHFPLALLADRSAAHRGESCGSRTQRTASEAWEYMVKKGGIDLNGHWWAGVRGAVWRFVGAKETGLSGSQGETKITKKQLDDLDTEIDPQSLLPLPDKVVITYISRQEVRRHLVPEDHDALVAALQELVRRKRTEESKDWELNIVQPETLSKDDQIRLAAKSTILLGVHGNGLTHLVFMNPNRVSTVIEIYYPGGFAHDYEWTTRALGMRHFTVWNDTYFTHPNEPPIGYPEGFHGTSIPVHGATIAKLIEERLQ